jgi:hypothetical protein
LILIKKVILAESMTRLNAQFIKDFI